MIANLILQSTDFSENVVSKTYLPGPPAAPLPNPRDASPDAVSRSERRSAVDVVASRGSHHDIKANRDDPDPATGRRGRAVRQTQARPPRRTRARAVERRGKIKKSGQPCSSAG
jgi:hypothetical protein